MVATRPPYRQTFVRLLGFLRPYKWSLIVSIILAVGSQAAAMAIAFLTGTGLEKALTARSRHDLYLIGVLVLAVGAARALLMSGRRLISGRQALGVEFDMRNALYAKLLRLSFGFYDRHQTGQLLSRATVDLQTVRFFLGYGLIFFFQNVLTVVGATALMFAVNWRLALVATAVTPLIVVFAYRYSTVAHPVLRDVQQKMADVATVAEENIVGVHVVKSFAQERNELGKFAQRSERVFERSVDANKQRALYVPLLSFLPLAMQAGVLLAGGRMVARGDLDIRTFFFFDENVEEEERADVEVSACDHSPAGEQDSRLHGEGQEREQRHVEGALLVRVDTALEDALGALRELPELVPLLGEGLDDVDADDVLLGDRRDVGHLLLDVAEHGMRDGRVTVGEDDDQRRDGCGDECEPPVDGEHERGRTDDRQHVLEEEDEPVTEEEADGLQIDSRPRQQLARLVAVVEAEREPEELRVEGVAHVELDAERLAARDQPPARHEEGARRADREHECGDQVEVVPALGRDRLFEPGSREEGDCHRRRLRADCQHDGDDERPLVRPEKAEQADECPAIRRSGCHHRNLAAATCFAGSRAGKLRVWTRVPGPGTRAARTSTSPIAWSAQARSTSSSFRASSRTSSSTGRTPSAPPS